MLCSSVFASCLGMNRYEDVCVSVLVRTCPIYVRMLVAAGIHVDVNDFFRSGDFEYAITHGVFCMSLITLSCMLIAR